MDKILSPIVTRKKCKSFKVEIVESTKNQTINNCPFPFVRQVELESLKPTNNYEKNERMIVQESLKSPDIEIYNVNLKPNKVEIGNGDCKFSEIQNLYQKYFDENSEALTELFLRNIIPISISDDFKSLKAKNLFMIFEQIKKISSQQFNLDNFNYLGDFASEGDNYFFKIYFRRSIISEDIIDFLIYDFTKTKEAEFNDYNLKTSFLAKIVHEFKTPLSSIIGLITKLNGFIIKKNYPNELNRTISQIEGLSNYVNILINDIIDYSHIYSLKDLKYNENNDKEKLKNKLNLKLNPINLKDITDFCKEILLTLLICKEKQNLIKIIYEFNEEIINYNLDMDEYRLKQILLNLISNSVKFTRCGSITLKADLINCNKNTCKSINNSEKIIKISIIDTGIGIKDEDLKKLLDFKENILLSSSSKYNKEGTGLGLNITKFIADELNINLEVFSTFGQGTSFNILINVNENSYKNNKKLKNKRLLSKSREDLVPVLSRIYEQKKAFNFSYIEKYNFKYNSATNLNLETNNIRSDLAERSNKVNFYNLSLSAESFIHNRDASKDNIYLNQCYENEDYTKICSHSDVNKNYNSHYANDLYLKKACKTSRSIRNNISSEENLNERKTIKNDKVFDNPYSYSLFNNSSNFSNKINISSNLNDSQNNNNFNNYNYCMDDSIYNNNSILEKQINCEIDSKKVNKFVEKSKSLNTNTYEKFNIDKTQEKNKILVIDDDFYIRKTLINIINKIISKKLQSNYFTIIEGRDGSDILKHIIKDQFNNNRIKCIITDENMEFMNGSEAIKIIRNLENSNKIKPTKIACCTALEEETIENYNKNTGFDSILPKPCDEVKINKFFEDINLFGEKLESQIKIIN